MPAQTHTTSAPCPVCGKGLLTSHLIDETFDFDVGEETVTVQARGVPVRRCDHCGEELSGPEAARVRHEAVCKAAGFFTPEELKALRKQVDLSQQDFAQLAGVGVATVSRVETGRLIQNRSTDNLFFLIARSEEARRLLAERLASRSRKRSNAPAGERGDAPGKPVRGNGSQRGLKTGPKAARTPKPRAGEQKGNSANSRGGTVG
jgi:putative zinc finger/helix-turn-helix YgiT family protein